LLTDSGGIQEETTYLGIPCLTVRPNTERPVTITHGTNALVESQCSSILDAVEKALMHSSLNKRPPEFWDGMTAKRIVALLQNELAK